MTAYSKADLERIAAAIGITRRAIGEYASFLDNARVFVEFHGKAMPKSPSQHREDLLRIAASARRLRDSLVRPNFVAAVKKVSSLLRHLGIDDWNEAADGPSADILDSLNYAEGTSRNAIVRLTCTIGDLPPLLLSLGSQAPSGSRIEIPPKMIKAVDELERVAGDAADRILHLGDLVVPKGHHGDLEVTGWIEDMARLYRTATGKHPTVWVNANAQASAFIRLLQAAGPPIGLNYSASAWRRRARAYLQEFPNNKFDLAL